MKRRSGFRWLVQRTGFVLAVSILMMLFFILTLSVLYYIVEGDQRAYATHQSELRSYFDWLYFTVITTRTIGFGDITVKTTLGKGLTIFNALLPASLFFGASMVLLDRFFHWIHDEYRRRLMRQHQHHHILVSDPDLLENIVEEYRADGRPFLCITQTPLEELPRHLREMLDDTNYHVGDPTRGDVLDAVNITEADAILIATPDDAVNLFILVTVRQKAPGIRTIVRVNRPDTEDKLRAVGADVLLPATRMLGRMISQAASHPVLLDLLVRLQTRTITPSLEEEPITPAMEGRPAREAVPDAVAVYRAGEFHFALGELVLAAGDVVLRTSTDTKARTRTT